MERDGILITGARGLLGRALLARLRGEGRRVLGVDLPAVDPEFPDIHAADLLDRDALFDMCAQNSIGRIVHCGGISGRAVARDDPILTINTNVIGTANVFEAARTFGIERVVLCSSGSVYGRLDADIVREDAALRPVNAYGASKVASEAVLHAYAADWGVDGVALRLFQVFGPRRTTRCNIKTMVKAVLEGRIARLPHGPETCCQYIYLSDAVEALALALDAKRPAARVYNVSGGTSLTLREAARIASEVLTGLRVEFGDDPSGAEYCLREIDLSAAKRDLGYAPRVGLAEGIRTYADWMRETCTSSPPDQTGGRRSCHDVACSKA